MVPKLAAQSVILAYPITSKDDRLRWDRLIDEKHYLPEPATVGLPLEANTTNHS